MSRYTLTPNAVALADAAWSTFASAVPLVPAQLADGSDSTGVRLLSAQAEQLILQLSTVTVPANELVVSAQALVRAKRAAGTVGVCTASLCTYPGSGSATTPLPGMPQVTLPVGSVFATALSAWSTPGALTQSQVDQMALLLVSPQAASYKDIWLSEANVQLQATSRVQPPSLSSPSGTVSDTTRPPVVWVHRDRIEATVTNKASSGTTRTLTTSAAHGFAVGQNVGVDIADPDYVPTGPISAVTSTTLSYPAESSKTQSTTAASGTTWIGEDKPQVSARVLVVGSAQYGAAGFTPDKALASGDYTWTTLLSGTTTSRVAPTVDLPNDSYRVYVRTASTYGSLTLTSDWAYSSWVQALTPATAPTLGVAYDEPTNRVALTIAGHSNLLTGKQASLEEGGTAGAWDTAVNCAISVQSTYAASGTNSLRLRSSAAGNMSVRQYLTTQPGLTTTVTAGQAYYALASFRAGATARSCRVDIQWLDAASTILSTTTGTAGNDATGSWTVRSAAGTAPAGAVYARLLLTVLATGAANEDHYVDQVGLMPGTAAAWSPGLVPTGPSGFPEVAAIAYELLLERSLDEETWTPVRTPPGMSAGVVGIVLDRSTQSAALYDYEAPRGGSVYYRASIVTVIDAGSPRASALTEAPVVTTLDGQWWLKAVDDPTLNAVVRVVGTPQTTRKEDRAVLYLDGRPRAVVVHGQQYGVEWAGDIEAASTEEREAVDALLSHQGQLLIQEPWLDSAGFGVQRWVDLADDWSGTWHGSVDAPRQSINVRMVETG